MYTTKQTYDILCSSEIKPLYIIKKESDPTNEKYHIVFVKKIEIPDTVLCKACEPQCIDCPLAPEAIKIATELKNQLETTVEGVLLSNEIDWFLDDFNSETPLKRQYAMNMHYIKDERRIDIYLINSEVFREINTVQIVKIQLLNSFNKFSKN